MLKYIFTLSLAAVLVLLQGGHVNAYGSRAGTCEIDGSTITGMTTRTRNVDQDGGFVISTGATSCWQSGEEITVSIEHPTKKYAGILLAGRDADDSTSRLGTFHVDSAPGVQIHPLCGGAHTVTHEVSFGTKEGVISMLWTPPGLPLSAGDPLQIEFAAIVLEGERGNAASQQFWFPVSHRLQCCESLIPTEQPTRLPSRVPTHLPTLAPSVVPTEQPTRLPSRAPTHLPTLAPSVAPHTSPMETHSSSTESEVGGTVVSGSVVTNTPVSVSSRNPSTSPTLTSIFSLPVSTQQTTHSLTPTTLPNPTTSLLPNAPTTPTTADSSLVVPIIASLLTLSLLLFLFFCVGFIALRRRRQRRARDDIAAALAANFDTFDTDKTGKTTRQHASNAPAARNRTSNARRVHSPNFSPRCTRSPPTRSPHSSSTHSPHSRSLAHSPSPLSPRPTFSSPHATYSSSQAIRKKKKVREREENRLEERGEEREETREREKVDEREQEEVQREAKRYSSVRNIQKKPVMYGFCNLREFEQQNSTEIYEVLPLKGTFESDASILYLEEESEREKERKRVKKEKKRLTRERERERKRSETEREGEEAVYVDLQVTWICPKCANVNSSSFTFCPKCEYERQ